MRDRHFDESPPTLDRPNREQDVDGADVLGDKGADVIPHLSTEQAERAIGIAEPPHRKHG
jgi:hypothetical protein